MGFFQGDYLSLIDYDFISKINLKNKFFYLTDDFDMHEVNTHTALACDTIMTCCPISVLKYKEKQLNAYFIYHESDNNVFKNLNIEKNNDVLFFGALKANRKNYIQKLEENKINFKVVGSSGNNYVTYEELNQLINKSKIILNFSSTGNKNKFISHKTHPFNYLYPKGRVMIAGLSGSLCISEHTPAHELIFSKFTIPEFDNPDDMIKEIKNLLKDEAELKRKTAKFEEECINYCDDKYAKKILKRMQTVSHRKKIKKFPYWYIRAFNIKSIRLYGKDKFLSSYIFNTFDNIKYLLKFKNFFYLLIILESLIYIPFIAIKILLNKYKIEKKR